jgi:hypothetical protein
MIKLSFKCGGCFTEEEVVCPAREFRSLNGRGFGFGHWLYPQIKNLAPAGWMAFDPYTGCTYCQSCWKGIEESS